MIRHPDRTATRSWLWSIDSSTVAQFVVGLSRGEYSHDGKCEVFVDSFEVRYLRAQLDVPLAVGNCVYFDREDMSEKTRERLEVHGRKALDESGWLDELIW